MNTPEEIRDAATALLATVRHTLTGRELEACEWAASEDHPDQFEEDLECWESDFPEDEPDRDGYTLNQEDEYEDDYQKWESALDEWRKTQADVGRKMVFLRNLHVQFYAEITNWLDAQDRKVSRQAVENHNRLRYLEPTKA